MEWKLEVVMMEATRDDIREEIGTRGQRDAISIPSAAIGAARAASLCCLLLLNPTLFFFTADY